MKKLLLILLLFSCSTAYRGQHIDQIIMKYGYPVITKPYGQGKAYFYNYHEDNPTTMYSRNGYTIINEASTDVYWLILYADPKGIIVKTEKIKR